MPSGIPADFRFADVGVFLYFCMLNREVAANRLLNT